MDELLFNTAPVRARVFRHFDLDGVPWALVVAKGSWDIGSSQLRTAASGDEAQAPVREGPRFGRVRELALDPVQRETLGPRLDSEILLADHDQVPPKPRFDVVVVGYGHAPQGRPHLRFDAGLRVGAMVATVRLLAPRIWRRSLTGLTASDPVGAVRKVPLSHAFTALGSGLSLPLGEERPTTLPPTAPPEPPLPPWLEAPDHPIENPDTAAPPVSLNHWPEHLEHRRRWAGTMDEQWRRERSPLPPRDFNPLFYNIADPALQLAAPPAADTPIRLVNTSPRGTDDALFPRCRLSVAARYTAGLSRTQQFPLTPDTLVLEPEIGRYSVVWRVLVPLRRESLDRLELRYHPSAA